MSSYGTALSRDTEANVLFNPAFCAVLLHRAIRGYEKKTEGQPLPVVYAFLVLPSALHPATRTKLPKKTTASMWSWLRSHPIILADFAKRARDLKPFVAEATIFAIQHSVLKATEGSLASGKLLRRPSNLQPTEDWEQCEKAASFLGKWLASTKADESTILTKWGVRP